MIRKILVANRGEIAIRVFRTAREMGIRTVAVASEADHSAMHTKLADEWVDLGPPTASESYLNFDKILNAAKHTGADAIHPGYGFLSENSHFADACKQSGIAFIGPSGDAMRKLGSKIDAKTLAVACGVPVTPGFFESGASDRQLKEAANQIGYPIMLKASAGGGGRGMRVVRDPADFDQELTIARNEAISGFGDGAMMVEKFVANPRHIEVQFLADTHGHRAALFERECSIQRRHQKLLEEAPSAMMTSFPNLWTKMREATLKLVEGSSYTGAGTAEFIVDPVTGEFYFLEVNARLQVEHPVTEAITGLDLVRQQILIASGEPMEVSQKLLDGDRSAIQGHALEARIVAEDPGQGFMPSIGKIHAMATPVRPGVRVDTGYESGSEVSRYYDSLIAKCIAHGETLETADAKLIAALQDFHILGVATNIEYLLAVLQHPDYSQRIIHTGFLAEHFPDWTPSEDLPAELADLIKGATTSTTSGDGPRAQVHAWTTADGFRNI